MILKQVAVGPLQCNCLLLGCEKTKEAVLVDPGDEPLKILKLVEEAGLKVKSILHTHAHFDHIAATEKVTESITTAKTYLHKGDELLYQNLPKQGQLFGFNFTSSPRLDHFLEDGQDIVFGEYTLTVIHTPGHSPGSCCFKLKGHDETLLSGDTLFHESVGRADLWGGDPKLLIHSIKDRLLSLDGDIKVYPGHGPSTTLGHEKRHNPFL